MVTTARPDPTSPELGSPAGGAASARGASPAHGGRTPTHADATSWRARRDVPWQVRAVVFASGAATMALQMCAVRLLAPWVGASALVWATTIGLSLVAMSAGYALGGRLADRAPTLRSLVPTLLAAAALVAVVPAVSGSLLPHVDLGLDDPAWASVVGAALGFGALFLAPAVLLGVTPPLAIRVATTSVDEGGRVAGAVYARSTIGSIVGTLVTALVLVQWIGTRATLGVVAALLVAAALVARRAPEAAAVHSSSQAELARSADADGARLATSLGLGVAALVVLVEGAATMSVEIAASRLLAPFFGASHVVWAVLIAVVLGAIAIGSRIGGGLADRTPSARRLACVIASAAATVALLPVAALPVMRAATGGIDDVDVLVVAGSFFATVAMLVPPVLLLGMVPPWVVRLAAVDVEHRGSVVGRLYALSTCGALVGTFGSALWLVPAIGTRRTFVVVAVLLLVVAAVLARTEARSGAARPGRLRSSARHGWRDTADRIVPWAAAAVVAAVAFLPTGLVKPAADARVLVERESRYQFVQAVQDEHGRRLLQLNEGWAVHSISDPRTVLTGGIWDHFLVLPALLDRPDLGEAEPSAPRMLLIGNAAGTAARAFRALRPGVRIDGVELDPVVTDVGRSRFDMDGSNLTVHEADGRPFLAHAGSRRWDIVHVDAYRQPYIPFYLATREFFALAKSHLARDGVLSINVGSTPEDPRIDEAVARTMRDVFPLVVRYRAEDYNEVILGMVDPHVSVDDLRARIRASAFARGTAPVLRSGDRPSIERRELREDFAAFADGIRLVRPGGGRVLTDDRADVEWLTDRMIFGAAG